MALDTFYLCGWLDILFYETVATEPGGELMYSPYNMSREAVTVADRVPLPTPSI